MRVSFDMTQASLQSRALDHCINFIASYIINFYNCVTFNNTLILNNVNILFC